MRNKIWIIISIMIVCMLIYSSCISAIKLDKITVSQNEFNDIKSDNTEIKPFFSSRIIMVTVTEMYKKEGKTKPFFRRLSDVTVTFDESSDGTNWTPYNINTTDEQGQMSIETNPDFFYKLTVLKYGFHTYLTKSTQYATPNDMNNVYFHFLMSEDESPWIQQENQLHNNKKNNPCPPSSLITAYVTEMYGERGDPNFRLLRNVTVIFEWRYHGLFQNYWILYKTGITDQEGKVFAYNDNFDSQDEKHRITVSKEGYHSYLTKPSIQVIPTNYEYMIVYVYFFMVEDGSPWEPPGNPTIEGSTSGTAGVDYNYTFTSIDPNEHMISYYIDWGDEDTTGWTTFQFSGAPFTISHKWTFPCSCTIKAKVKNTKGDASIWTEFTVKMPKDKSISISPLFRFLEKFPLLNRLLNIKRCWLE